MPEIRETIIEANKRRVSLFDLGAIAGCIVSADSEEEQPDQGAEESVVIYEELESLRRFKDDVQTNNQAGMWDCQEL